MFNKILEDGSYQVGMYEEAAVIYKASPEMDLKLYKDFNRDITFNKNVKRLEESLKDKNLLKDNPIVVRKEEDGFYIIDGQSRNQAALAIGADRYFIITKEENLNIIIKFNTNQKNWVLKDYAKFWSSMPETSEVYNIYNDYMKCYGSFVTPSIMLMLWNNNRRSYSNRFTRSTKYGGNSAFKEGKLTFNNKIKRRLDKYLPCFEEVYHSAHTPPLTKGTVRRQLFQEVLLNSRKSPCFNYERFLKKLCTYPQRFNELRRRSDIEEHMYTIERS